MLRKTVSVLSFRSNKSKSTLKSSPNYTRANLRRRNLEDRRIEEAQWMPQAIEPTPEQARLLYRSMLKMANQTLKVTDKKYFQEKLRFEFEITARQTSGRVRGLMYEKGHWMLKNNLGGII